MSNITATQVQLLDKFTKTMRDEMLSNGHKGDITCWNASLYELIAEISYHIAKLTKAMLEVERGGMESSRVEVDEFAADVANYMAKTAQQFGTLVIER